MDSVKKTKGNKVILEKSAYFVGRFLTKVVNDSALEKLRGIIRLDKGYKTKLRLGVEGVSSGHKFSAALLKNRLPYDFIPLTDIINVLQDTKYKNLLLFVVTLTSIQYEIVAFRTKDEKTVLDFIESFSYVTSGNKNYSSTKLWRHISNISDARQTQSTYSRNTADFSLPSRQLRSPSPSGSVSSNVSSKSGSRLYRREPSPVFDGNVYQRAGSYRWNSHVYSRHHRRTFKPSDVTSTTNSSQVQLVRDFQVQVHLDTSLPVDIKMGDTFAVKSYSHIVKLYVYKGIALADVSCQTKTVAVVTHQDILLSDGHMSQHTSKSASVRSNSLASESFRRQVDELTQEVKELRYLLNNKDKNVQTTADQNSSVNNTNAHGHQNGSEISSSISSNEDPHNRTKTPSRVAWSPRLEQFAFDSDLEVEREGPWKTSTPRNGTPAEPSKHQLARNTCTARVSGYFMRTRQPEVVVGTAYATNNREYSSATEEQENSEESRRGWVFHKQPSTIAITNSHHDKRPSIMNFFRNRSKSPGLAMDNNKQECVYRTKIDIKSRGRPKARDRHWTIAERSASAPSASRQTNHKSVLYVSSGGVPTGGRTSGVARQAETVYLPGTNVTNGGIINNDEQYPIIV